jgi:hypothetical protein
MLDVLESELPRENPPRSNVVQSDAKCYAGYTLNRQKTETKEKRSVFF